MLKFILILCLTSLASSQVPHHHDKVISDKVFDKLFQESLQAAHNLRSHSYIGFMPESCRPTCPGESEWPMAYVVKENVECPLAGNILTFEEIIQPVDYCLHPVVTQLLTIHC